MDNDFLSSILKWLDFPVLISTILGGAILWFISEKSKKGRIRIFVNETKLLGLYPDESGGMHETKNLKDHKISKIYLWISLDIYNSSEYMKIAREIKFKVTISNSYPITLPAFRGAKEISSLNLEPKKLELVHFSTTLSKELFREKQKVYLIYKNESGKRKSIQIDISHLFS